MTQRRELITASAAGLLAMFATRSNGQQNSITPSLTDEEEANIRQVDRFCQAWEAMDLAQVTATMKTDAVYRQSQNATPVTGHQGLIDLMQPWIDSSNQITYEVLETLRLPRAAKSPPDMPINNLPSASKGGCACPSPLR